MVSQGDKDNSKHMHHFILPSRTPNEDGGGLGVNHSLHRERETPENTCLTRTEGDSESSIVYTEKKEHRKTCMRREGESSTEDQDMMGGDKECRKC